MYAFTYMYTYLYIHMIGRGLAHAQVLELGAREARDRLEPPHRAQLAALLDLALHLRPIPPEA